LIGSVNDKSPSTPPKDQARNCEEDVESTSECIDGQTDSPHSSCTATGQGIHESADRSLFGTHRASAWINQQITRMLFYPPLVDGTYK
jgi:hypothetical protein